ncbi:MAG: hypothetical protein KBT04_04495 [Bacteroidales bacterium]|nr:hypothetical protein [Candidatus Colimorpha onthohippi]
MRVSFSPTGKILRFTDSHPYYTQQLSSQVWDMMTYQNITSGVVQKAVASLITMHDLDYERLW